MSMFLISSMSRIFSQVVHHQAGSPEPLGHTYEDFCGRTMTPHKVCSTLFPFLSQKSVGFILLVPTCSTLDFPALFPLQQSCFTDYP